MPEWVGTAVTVILTILGGAASGLVVVGAFLISVRVDLALLKHRADAFEAANKKHFSDRDEIKEQLAAVNQKLAEIEGMLKAQKKS